jgi:multiple sugar transport system permease protein
MAASTTLEPVDTQKTPRKQRRRRRSISPRRIVGWVVLIALGLMMVFPFVWSVSTSLQTSETLLQIPPKLIPENPTLDAYQEVARVTPFVRMVINSVIVTVVVVALQIVTSALAGYGLARFRFRGRQALLLLYLATLMVPFQVTIVPLFIGMSRLGWLNTLHALMLPMVASAFGVFLFRQYFMQMPAELEEAAAIDGANPWRTFWSVSFPYARPAVATFGILATMAAWNSFLWPLFVARDESSMTIPVGLASLHGRYQTDWNLVMAGSVIAVVPVIIVFVLVQRHISDGLLLGGVNK